MIFCFN